jgi:hypothetical protein
MAGDINPRAVSGEFDLRQREQVMTPGSITVAWKSFVAGVEDAAALPATLGTPQGAWTYGAATDLIETDAPAQIVIKAESLKGKIGLCLISEDYSSLASDQQLITPADGKATVTLTFNPDKSPARLLVRNYADGGNAGLVRIESAEMTTKK